MKKNNSKNRVFVSFLCTKSFVVFATFKNVTSVFKELSFVLHRQKESLLRVLKYSRPSKRKQLHFI